jgi:hypothetical protein
MAMARFLVTYYGARLPTEPALQIRKAVEV